MTIYCQQYLDQIKQISLSNKYTKTYIDICKRASKRGIDKKLVNSNFGYIESHHIVPRSFKLVNSKIKENTVNLTAREHFICHLLLTKMFEGKFKSKMIYSAFMLSNINESKYKINSGIYESLRIKFAEIISISHIGKKHPERTSATFTKEWRENISKAQKGRKTWNKGIKRTEEELNSIKEGIKKKGGRKGKNNGRFGTGGKYKWMVNLDLNKDKLVPIDLINEFKSNGYNFGRLPMSVEQKVKLTNYIRTEEHIKNNAKAIKELRWIYDPITNETYRIHKSELEQYLKDGWKRGTAFNKKK